MQREKKKEKVTGYTRSVDNYKKYNTCVMGIPEGEEREKEAKEIMAGGFQNQ